MTKPRLVSKETGLLRGDASKIARIHRCSPNHVHYVAKGVRNGKAALVETIHRYQQLASQHQPAGQAGA